MMAAYGKPKMVFGSMTNRLMGVKSCSVSIVAPRAPPGRWFLFFYCWEWFISFERSCLSLSWRCCSPICYGRW